MFPVVTESPSSSHKASYEFALLRTCPLLWDFPVESVSFTEGVLRHILSYDMLGTEPYHVDAFREFLCA